MLYIKKGNRVLKIDDGEKDNFLQDGYVVIDDSGKVTEQKETKESKLKAEKEALISENKELKADIKKVQSELKKLKDKEGKAK